MRSLATYAFGIARSHDGTAPNRPLLSELCEILSSKLGSVFVAHVAPSYRSLATAVERGQVAFAWVPPLLALEFVRRGTAIPLALPLRNGNATSYHSAIVAHKDGPKSFAELAGKRAAWVERESVAGYIVPRIHLGLSGFNIRHFASETFVHGHEAVIEAIVAHRADVGATFCNLDPFTNRVVQAGWTRSDGTCSKPVNILALVGPIPNDAIVASLGIQIELRESFTSWLFARQSERAHELLMRILRADSMVRATSAHFEPLRAVLENARGKGLYR